MLSPIDLPTLHPPASSTPTPASHCRLSTFSGPASVICRPAHRTLDGLADCSMTERTGRTSRSSEVRPSAPESRIPILRLFMRFVHTLPTSDLVPTGNLRSSLLLLCLPTTPSTPPKGPFASPEPLRVTPALSRRSFSIPPRSVSPPALFTIPFTRQTSHTNPSMLIPRRTGHSPASLASHVVNHPGRCPRTKPMTVSDPPPRPPGPPSPRRRPRVETPGAPFRILMSTRNACRSPAS